MTRRSPGAPILLTLTRWDPDDLAARILAHEGRKEDGGRWTVVHLEAIATGKHPDPLGRAPGDPLPHPKVATEDRETLLAYWSDVQASIPLARDWASLYQGDPQPAEGALLTAEVLRRRTHLTEHPEAVKAAVSVDPSGGGRDTAGIIGGFLGADQRLYITHDRTGVMPSDQWARRACELAAEIGADRIIVEKNYGGDMARLVTRSAWDALNRELQQQRAEAEAAGQELPENPYDRHPPRIVEVSAKKGKRLRADPIAQQFIEDRARLGAVLPNLTLEWTTWCEGVDSPGRIDASCYLAYDLLPVPGAGKLISTAADVSRASIGGGGSAVVRRPY